MQRIAYWFIPIIAIAVTILVALFLVQINQSEPIAADQIISVESNNPKHLNTTESLWLDRFSKSEKDGYFYPVNEIYITLDLEKQLVKQSAFKLTAIIEDQYQLFCLQEELKQRGFRYFLKKVRQGTELLIYSKDQKKLQSLVKALKSYKIKAKILPYEEEKNG
ncbi:MAG: hypothetical protein U9P71_08895 [Campylobacterota bacterium]|nr:hypothetical protein [Campylobacterota bacterium]